MLPINIKDHVRQAIRTEWPAFAAAHPNLAAFLEQDLLVEPALAKLQDDPEYQAALATATTFGMAGEAVVEVIRRCVTTWLQRLV